jgi:hypothetical protein
VVRNLLDEQRKNLQLSLYDAVEIASEVLKPLREYERSKEKYRQTLIDTQDVEDYPFCEATRSALKEYQTTLGLQDEDVEAIVQDVLKLT